MITVIESKQNATLRHLARLAREKKYRQTMHEMVCEGEKMLYEALSSSISVKTILLRTEDVLQDAGRDLIEQAEKQGAKIFTCDARLFAQASDVETPQGILFSCQAPDRLADALPEKISSAILLDGVQDPGNLGTILRTADAFALDAVILCEGCTDPTSPKVVRSTMGAAFRQAYYRMPLDKAIAAMQARGLRVCAAALEPDSQFLSDGGLQNTAVIIGNEGRGVTEQALRLCDEKIIIPMRGRAESLNASVAAAILIWEMTRGELRE